MEQFGIGAVSAMTATLFSNPLEVVKTRFQLQGELKARGHHVVHYKNFFHAFYVIARADGLLALQKGLVPALWHQLFMNGIRLGGFQVAEDMRLMVKADGSKSLGKTAAVAGVMGAVTAFTGSPFYLVKIQMQAQSSEAIAVGTQHQLKGLWSALVDINKRHGITGLWRGCLGSLPRRVVGSSTQLVSFTYCKDILATNQFWQVPLGHANSFISGVIGGFLVTVVMNPLDTISTRLYNQGVDPSGRGLLYSSYLDCVTKMAASEGLRGFYKGFVPMFIRTGPHTVLVLFFWDVLKDAHKRFISSAFKI